MPAPLDTFLRALNSGNGVLSPEMWEHFGGDALLKELQKFDPNAHATTTDIGGGEGGASGQGKRLDYDVRKLPASKMGTAGYDLRSSNHGDLINPNAVTDDANYGNVTNSKNVLKPTDPQWTIYAPMVVAALAPMLGAYLAAAGIGGGVAAGAVTGSGVSGAAPGWLTSAVKKGPGIIGNLSHGNYEGAAMGALPVAGQGVGIDPNVTSAGSSLLSLTRRR